MRNFYKYILTLVALLMMTSNAWALRYAKAIAKSSPTQGGWVWVTKTSGNAPSSWDRTEDSSEDDNLKTSTYTFPFYYYANPQSGYVFKGWATVSNTNTVSSTTQSNWYVGVTATGDNNVNWKPATATYYAIFAKLATNVSELNFEKNVDEGWGDEQSLEVTYVHAGDVTATISGEHADDFSFSNTSLSNQKSIVFNNTDSEASQTTYIYFNPSESGNRAATLTFTGNGMTKTVILNGNGNKIGQSLSWNNESAIEANMQLGKTQTVTATATSGLAVAYSSSDNRVLIVDASGKITAVGIGNATITASQAGNYKYNAADPSITKSYTVWNKNTPIFTPNGFNEANVCHLKVGDKVTLEVLNVSDGLSGDFKVNTDNNILGITRNGNTITIEALNAGTADAIFTQTENNDIFGAEKKYQFSVSKINNTLAIASSSYTKYVDDVITNIISSVNSDATITTTSSDATIAYYDVTNNNIQIPNSDAKSFSSQTITITIAQAETYKYTAAEKTITLTVNKYTPTFTWNAGGATYYYLSSINNIFSTTNNDFGYTIVSDNEHVAKVIDNTLHIYNVEETANITVTQAENYKWNGKTETYTVNPVELNNHVTFNITETNHTIFDKTFSSDAEWSSTGGYRLGDGGWSKQEDYVIIGFTGIPDELSFEKVLEKSLGQLPGSDDCVCRVYESVDGNEWGEHIWEHSARVETYSAVVQLAPTTKFVKFYYNGTVYCNFRNIKVTELFQFAASPNPLDFGTESATGIMQTKQVVFEHANAGRETTVTIEGADAKFFSVSPTTIANTGRDLYGTVYLDVIFDNDGEIRGTNPYNAILVITDNAGNREEVALTGIRDGKGTPVFTWNPNNFPYYFNTTIANIAISSNTDYANRPLTFTTSDASIAEVKDGTLYIYQKGEAVTITVSQGENADYYAHTETFTFTPKSKPDLTVPFHVDGTIYTNAITVSDKCSWDEGNNQMKLGDGAWDDSKKTAILVFSEIPDKLSFSYATSYGLAVIEIGSTANPKWMVEESADGTSWNTIWEQSTNSTSWDNAEIQLSETTQYVRFSYDGNYAGYFRNINVTALDGYKYLRATDGQYLSRGNYWGTQAVVDAFGMACRITRYTRDNVNQYTQFRFVDNAQYLYEADNHELFTDHGTAANSDNLWQINNNGGILTIQSGNTVGDDSKKGYYVTLTDNVLALTDDASAATKWEMEDYTEHDQYIIDMLNRQAAEAAKEDFGADVNTLEKVRNRLKTNDFDIIPITITELTLGEQKGEYREESGTFAVYDQTKTGLEPGFYRLTVKALYRMSESDIAWQCKKSGLESVLAYAYANDVKYPIQSVYDSYHSGQLTTDDELRDSKYYSTTLESADKAFDDANRYLNDVYVYVEADEGKTTGTLRYGIKNPSYVPGAWLAYEEITLTLLKRKEYIFEGTDATQPKDWHTAENWNRKALPGQYHKVTIKADANISESVDVYHMNIEESKKVTISATGGLTVGVGGVTSATENSITIENNPSGVGYFRIDPSAISKPSKVTVNYTPNAKSGSPRDEQWQYVGAPGKDMNMSGSGLMIYHWSEQDGWLQANTAMQPFVGYALTRTTSATDAYAITASPIYENQTITLTKTDVSNGGMGGSNLFVNSYLAPIDLSKFDDDDFSGVVDKTFYLFNSGSWHQWQNQGGADNTIKNGSSPGQYYAISSLGAGFLDANKDQTTIPPMQGVYVIAGDGGGLINLNYEKHIYNGTATDMNRPMRAPQMHDEDFMRIRLQVNSENSGADRMYVIQHPECTKGYDNGYDAKNIIAANQANIYTNEKEGQMEISFADQIDSTWIGFRAGEDSEYTLTFSSIIGEEIYLYDSDADTLLLMTEEEQYTFSAQAHSVNDKRFRLILRAEISNDVNTGDDEWEAEARFWVHNKIVYIDQAPAQSMLAVYSTSGLVMSAPYEIQYTPCTIDLSYLPNGVYILRLNDQAYKFVCK